MRKLKNSDNIPDLMPYEHFSIGAVIARRIKIARIAQGMTQKELGIKMGIPEHCASTRISRYEAVEVIDYTPLPLPERAPLPDSSRVKEFNDPEPPAGDLERLVAWRIKKHRIRFGLTQKELGMRIGIDEDAASTRINRYETGKSSPDMETVERIGAVFGLPLSSMFAEDELTSQLCATFMNALERLPAEKIKRLIEKVNEDHPENAAMAKLLTGVTPPPPMKRKKRRSF